MKQYHLSYQKDDVWCVPACLQAILRYENQEVNQKKIYKKLNKLESGFVLINDEKIKKFLKKRGFEYEYYYHDKTPYNEPDTLLKEMTQNKNHGIIGTNNHAYLLVDFKDPRLTLLNPQDGSAIEKNIFELNMEMYEISQGIFGLIRKL